MLTRLAPATRLKSPACGGGAPACGSGANSSPITLFPLVPPHSGKAVPGEERKNDKADKQT
jgi:hypothetical protein